MMQIISFELLYRFRRRATYIFFLILFLISFFFVSTDAIVIGSATGNIYKNAPYVVNQVVMLIMLFGTMIISAVMGVPVYRDFEHGFHEILFATPVKKSAYLGGRFFGSYLAGLFIFSGLILGSVVGIYMPWVDKERVGPFMLAAYTTPLFYYIIPNLFLMGAIFFSLGSLLRNQFAIYVQGVVFFSVYLILLQSSKDIENDPFYSLLDPFGVIPTFYITRYWTPAEKNLLTVPLEGVLLWNRVIWTVVACLCSFLFFYLFKFSKTGLQLKKKVKAIEPEKNTMHTPLSIPALIADYSALAKTKMWFHIAKLDFLASIRSVPFIAITACGLLMLFSNTVNLGKMYGVNTYPVTYMILDALQGEFSLFVYIIISFYTGELIWKDRQCNFASITDSLPVSKIMIMTARFASISLLVAFLQAVLMLSGIMMQTFNDYYRYDIAVYLKQLYLNQYPSYILVVLLAFFIHNLVNNKFLGHTLVIIYYIGFAVLPLLDITHHLAWYGDAPSAQYSDMNKFGHYLYPVYLFYLCWLGLGITLFLTGVLLSRHGSEINFKTRWHQLKNSWRQGQGQLIIPLGLLVYLLCGGFIWYNTTVLNEFLTPDDEKTIFAGYEKKYRAYLDSPQPRITDVNVAVDLFPEKREAALKGFYWIQNKSKKPIDSLHVFFSDNEVQINKLNFGVSAIEVDNYHNFHRIYQLGKPLLPGDSVKVEFHLSYGVKGFKNNPQGLGIVDNGTFINNSFLPSFGYSESVEITDNDDRKENGLQKKYYSMKALSDSTGVQNTYLGQDADWVRYECIISTSSDQIALSPGYLQKEWIENGRNYFHYKMDAPILNFFSFLSARYEVFRDMHKDVEIEIYYHPTHSWNIQKMNESIKKTLDYCSSNFSPYQFRQVRILEFPRYESFAQSFPNTIPFSEAIGFIYKVDKETDIDNAFYVTAHEVAHQWWGHQVTGANTLGSTIMVETMAQYTALMVMEHEYGKNAMEKFMKYELDGYLRGRSREKKSEQPMVSCDNQGYIHYKKGSVVMYALKDYIGEDSLNAAVRRFVNDFGFQSAPYVQSPTFVKYLRTVTPDSMKYIIPDLFEKITLYNLKAEEAKSEKSGNGYKVTLTVDVQKVYADSIGHETKTNLNDWMDIGIYAEGAGGKDSLIYLKKYFFSENKNTFDISVSLKPVKAGIDPLHKLVDRDTEDNTKICEGI